MKTPLSLVLLITSAVVSNAAVTVDHLWSFNGSAGSVAPSPTTLPDTGATPFTSFGGGATAIGNSTPSPTGGGTYLVTDGTGYSGIWDAYRTGATLATDNFGIQMWLRLDPSIAASNSTQNAVIFTSGTGNSGLAGNFMLNYTSSGLQVAKLVDKTWGTQTVLIPGTTTITDNAWHNIAVVSVNGTTSLYLDGLVIGTASATFAGGNEDFHLALKPNGYSSFAGNLDEVSYFTFDNTTTVFNPLTDLYINQIPEPSTYGLGMLAIGLAAFPLLRRRGKTAK